MLVLSRFVIALSVGLLLTCSVQAEWVPGKRMNVSMTRILGKAKNLVEKSDYYFADDTCLFAGFIGNNESMTLTREFTGGETYVLLGAGDNNATDVDIELLNSENERISADTEDDAEPAVKFKPKKTGTYKMKIVLQETKDSKSGSFCSLVVLSTKGYEVPLDNLASALGSLGARADGVHTKAETLDKDLYFNSGAGTICLFGALVPKGDNLTISNMTLRQGEYVLIASADKTSKDIDLYVLDENDKVFKKDEDDDAAPVIVFNVAKGGSKAGLRVKNTEAKGASLCMFALLKLVPKE